jgi:hypothetical protein
MTTRHGIDDRWIFEATKLERGIRSAIQWLLNKFNIHK